MKEGTDGSGWVLYILMGVDISGRKLLTDYRDGEFITAKAAYIKICTEVRVAG